MSYPQFKFVVSPSNYKEIKTQTSTDQGVVEYNGQEYPVTLKKGTSKLGSIGELRIYFSKIKFKVLDQYDLYKLN